MTDSTSTDPSADPSAPETDTSGSMIKIVSLLLSQTAYPQRPLDTGTDTASSWRLPPPPLPLWPASEAAAAAQRGRGSRDLGWKNRGEAPPMWIGSAAAAAAFG